ncbi:XkdF-like putative serine protease domain-containing protein [Hymenobacter siberiensis]|uniref:XkdF-like putative serine protease domain-containing protein n=1 Tax=Hymenobacter siberiensis TaxID=2848396 RepID=UPI001C1DE108|nr:XkdF-like putative serine protease domain-containing protein [Hymenobacter siberiensis]
MQLPLFQLEIDEFDDETGMFLISMVDAPAMKVAAVLLAEQEAPLVTLKAVNDHKRYLTSAVIIPDKLIFRTDARRGDYNIQFSVDQIEKIRNKFFQSTGNLRLSNKNHVESDVVQAQLIESWIIDDPKMDKAVALGFDLPKGTMMATYQITDEQFWNEEVLTGNVTGFSLEGRFTEAEVQLMEEKGLYEHLLDILDAIEG